MEAEIEDFIEGFNQPYRGMRIQGQRVATWSSPARVVRRHAA
jgi:hypothetical protein